MRKVILKDGTEVPQLGQGTWYMGESSRKYAGELEALCWGIDHGMTLIDTAEMYGEGASEELIGEAIQPYDREKLFLVSKVYPWNAGRRNIFDSCEASLERLGTDYLDLYLLHWPGSIPLAETVACMEKLKAQGKIRRWGVSNFDTYDMQELYSVKGGENCMVNQVLYHLGSRGVEYELLPWMQERGITMMAYCPLAQAGRLRRELLNSPVLRQIAAAHDCDVLQILLAFTMIRDNVISIPKASSAEHVKANREAAEIVLTAEECALLDQAFPAPTHKVRLDMQ